MKRCGQTGISPFCSLSWVGRKSDVLCVIQTGSFLWVSRLVKVIFQQWLASGCFYWGGIRYQLFLCVWNPRRFDCNCSLLHFLNMAISKCTYEKISVIHNFTKAFFFFAYSKQFCLLFFCFFNLNQVILLSRSHCWWNPSKLNGISAPWVEKTIWWKSV